MKHSQLALSLALFILTSLALPAATIYWDADGTPVGNDPNSGTGLGGSGNWDQLSLLWFNGLTDIPWVNANNDDAVFTGTGGTVTNTENINAGSLFFTNVTDSFLITNATGAETLTLATGTIDTGGGDHTIGTLLAGSGPLTKNGDGRVHLAGNSTGFSGPVSVSSGVVSVENYSALGSGAATVTNGAALEVAGDLSAGSSGVLNAVTVSGTGITNSGVIRNTSGVNNWFGAITLAADGVRINSDSGTFDMQAGGISGTGDLNLFVGGAGNVRIDGGGLNLGAGTLTKDGSGTMAINENTGVYPTVYSYLVVNGGSVSVGTSPDANLGTVPGSFLYNQITLNGAGLQTSSTFTMSATRGIFVTTNGGSITINSGALTVCQITSTNTDITLNCTAGSATDLFLGAPLNLGTGGFIKTGPKTMNLNGKSSIIGKLTITGGQLSWGSNDTPLGPVPASTTPDYITLDGGALNPSNTQTINARRGITLGPNGGSIGENTSSGTLTIAGVITA